MFRLLGMRPGTCTQVQVPKCRPRWACSRVAERVPSLGPGTRRFMLTYLALWPRKALVPMPPRKPHSSRRERSAHHIRLAPFVTL